MILLIKTIATVTLLAIIARYLQYKGVRIEGKETSTTDFLGGVFALFSIIDLVLIITLIWRF